MNDVLILFYSRNGSTAQLARRIARGVEEVPGMRARLRSVPPVAAVVESAQPPVPDEGAPYVDDSDLRECCALILGSPTRFGNMAAPLKHYIDSLGAQWASGTLVGKPAGVFTSTSTMHGGQESTLLSMILPLLHHGMLITGIPFTEAALNRTTTGGTRMEPAMSRESTEIDRSATTSTSLRAASVGVSLLSPHAGGRHVMPIRCGIAAWVALRYCNWSGMAGGCHPPMGKSDLLSP